MTVGGHLPRLFIGSSVEKLEIARALQETLQFDFEGTVWTQEIFRPTRYALPELVEAMKVRDFGAFILAADDVVTMRGKQLAAVRDNVIFEIGVFVGAKGAENCFLLSPRSSTDLHLPTDLMGLSAILYEDHRSDDNLLAALEPACNQIRRAARARKLVVTSASDRLERYITQWNGPELGAARESLRSGIVVDPYAAEAQIGLAHLRKIFSFLDSMADAVLDSQIDETLARTTFEQPMRALWPWAATLLAPPNHVEDYWEPLPSLAVLLQKWK